MELLEIEKEIAGPDGAAAVRRRDAALAALGGRAADALARGVPPDEYGRLGRLAECVDVARKLLRLQYRGSRPAGAEISQP